MTLVNMNYTAEKMKLSIKDFFSKCDQISISLQICSHLLKKFSMGNFIFLYSVNSQFSAALFIFTKEVLNRQFYFLCSVKELRLTAKVPENIV